MIVTTAPFKHVILDDHWPDDLLEGVLAEFPPYSDGRWQKFSNERELKLGGSDSMWGPYAWTFFDDCLNDPDFVGELAEVFGVGSPLLVDAGYGGGFHMIPPGGYLASHVDFNRHRRTGLWRRLNLITFLNSRDWVPAFGGELVLGADGDVVIEPVWNRTVIFETNDESWHGHPTPTADDFWRCSFAAYFYSDEPPPTSGGEHSTVFLGAAA
jgi:hypothetical protein